VNRSTQVRLAGVSLNLLEIRTPRWTAYKAVRFGVQMDPKVPMITQERVSAAAEPPAEVSRAQLASCGFFARAAVSGR
jgi:hypothetical protein